MSRSITFKHIIKNFTSLNFDNLLEYINDLYELFNDVEENIHKIMKDSDELLKYKSMSYYQRKLLTEHVDIFLKSVSESLALKYSDYNRFWNDPIYNRLLNNFTKDPSNKEEISLFQSKIEFITRTYIFTFESILYNNGLKNDPEPEYDNVNLLEIICKILENIPITKLYNCKFCSPTFIFNFLNIILDDIKINENMRNRELNRIFQKYERDDNVQFKVRNSFELINRDDKLKNYFDTIIKMRPDVCKIFKYLLEFKKIFK